MTTELALAFNEMLKTLAWCKQGESTLVAVHKAIPEVIFMLPDREVKVFPGGVAIKMQKSTVSHFQKAYDDGEPLNVVLVAKPTGVEVWYRKVAPTEFPYDAWGGGAASAYEQQRALIPAENLGDHYVKMQAELSSKCKECPTMMPPY